MSCLVQHECTQLDKRAEARGLYYEGFVEDIDSIRQKHQAATVSTYGIRRSRTNSLQTREVNSGDKGNKVGITYKGVKIVVIKL